MNDSVINITGSTIFSGNWAGEYGGENGPARSWFLRTTAVNMETDKSYTEILTHVRVYGRPLCPHWGRIIFSIFLCQIICACCDGSAATFGETPQGRARTLTNVQAVTEYRRCSPMKEDMLLEGTRRRSILLLVNSRHRQYHGNPNPNPKLGDGQFLSRGDP